MDPKIKIYKDKYGNWVWQWHDRYCSHNTWRQALTCVNYKIAEWKNWTRQS